MVMLELTVLVVVVVGELDVVTVLVVIVLVVVVVVLDGIAKAPVMLAGEFTCTMVVTRVPCPTGAPDHPTNEYPEPG